MAICSYCGKDKKLTREHLIPDWYLQIDRSPQDITFLERAKSRFIESDPVIRDVCAECNNGPLSALDSYGRAMYTNLLHSFVLGEECPELTLDYTKLAKWLLKIAFNSARTNGTDLEVLTSYAPLLIGSDSLPADLLIFASTVAPAAENTDGSPRIAVNDEEIVHTPSWFRIGVFRIADHDAYEWSLRHIAINSYCFYLAVPPISSPDAASQANALAEAMRRQPHFGVEVSRSQSTVLRAPTIDSLTYSLSHIGAFPFSYEVIQNDVIKQFIEGDFGVLQYWIDREDIEASNETNILGFLASISSNREIALALRGKVEFLVHGYDEDPRELYEVPEVRQFLAKINRTWPYWMLYQWEHGMWLRVLGLCLVPCTRNNEGRVEFSLPDMDAIVDDWFGHLNEISHRFAITLSINKEASEVSAKVLFGSAA